MSFDSFASDILATVVGGALLAMLFFFLKEQAFPLPDLSGKWHFELKIAQTEYGPYQGMVVRYLAFLWREGSAIHGSVEKVQEISSAGEVSYVGSNRTRGNVTGWIEKNYTAPDRIVLHIVEEGHKRESSHLHELATLAAGTMTGTFVWTAAEGSGAVSWRRA